MIKRTSIAIILCGLALYCIPLQNTSFYFDDYPAIVDNHAIKTLDPSLIFDAFNTRFLVGLSFALNYKFGGLHPEGYRLVNLLIHCLNAFLVYLLIRFTLGHSCLSSGDLGRGIAQSGAGPAEHDWGGPRAGPHDPAWPAFFGALLFLCHPIQTEPVNFITQRFVLMAGFFYLLTMVLYIQYRKLSQKRYLFAALLSAAAAMFCKEFSVTLPVMLALYEFYFLPDEKLGRRCRRLVPFFIIVLIVPLLLLRTPPDASSVAAIADGHNITRARGGVGRQEYFLTELNVVRTYVRLLLLPIDQDLDYDYPLSPSLDTKTALSGLFLLGLLALAWFTWRSYRLISFGILWFFIALSIESSVIPIWHVIAEYRLYLASVGFVFAVISVIFLRKAPLKRSCLIATVILAGLCVLTFQRNLVWRNELSLWDDTVKKSPHKARPYNNRGIIWAQQGQFVRALADYDKAIALNPDLSQVYCNRASVYEKQKRFALAIADYDTVLGMDPGFAPAYNGRGFIYNIQGRLAYAISDYDKAIKIDPGYAQAYDNRGVSYAEEGFWDKALADYTKAIALNPDDTEAYNNRGVILGRQGRFAQAMSDFNKAIATDPKNPESYNNRGSVYSKENDLGAAILEYNKAIEINPDYALAYNNRAILYYQMKEYGKARADAAKVQALREASGKAQ